MNAIFVDPNSRPFRHSLAGLVAGVIAGSASGVFGQSGNRH
jgi:hypothetical protein